MKAAQTQVDLEIWKDNGVGLYIVSPGERLAVDVTGDDVRPGGAPHCCRFWNLRWWERRQECDAETVTSPRANELLARWQNGRLVLVANPGSMVQNLRAWLGVDEDGSAAWASGIAALDPLQRQSLNAELVLEDMAERLGLDWEELRDALWIASGPHDSKKEFAKSVLEALEGLEMELGADAALHVAADNYANLMRSFGVVLRELLICEGAQK